MKQTILFLNHQVPKLRRKTWLLAVKQKTDTDKVLQFLSVVKGAQCL